MRGKGILLGKLRSKSLDIRRGTMKITIKVILSVSLVTCINSVGASERPLVLIPYRGGENKCAKGIFFDHSVIRKMNVDTKVIVNNDEEKTSYESKLYEYLKGIVAKLPLCSYDVDINGIKIPKALTVDELQSTTDIQQCGLLFLPGWQGKCPQEREKLDRAIIKNALKNGQPIFAVCAGCWNLMRFGSECFMKIPINRITVSVKDHTASKMISISENKRQVINNTSIHAVQIHLHSDSLLSGVIQNEQQHKVNSVHKEAIDKELINKTYWDIWATSVRNSNCSNRDGSNKLNRQGKKMDSQGDIVEAFECKKYGTPIIGTQWHAEAYVEQNDIGTISNNLIKFMISAGTKYKMLKELKAKFAAH